MKLGVIVGGCGANGELQVRRTSRESDGGACGIGHCVCVWAGCMCVFIDRLGFKAACKLLAEAMMGKGVIIRWRG